MAKQRLEESYNDTEYGKLIQSVEDLRGWQKELGKQLNDFFAGVNDKFTQHEIMIREILFTQQAKFDAWCALKEKEMDEKIKITSKRAEHMWLIGKVFMWLATASGVIFLIQLLLQKS